MKKDVWFFAGLISFLCFFTACTDEDETQNQTTTYTGENLTLTVNNKTTLIGLVTLERTSASQGIVTLFGIIPDNIGIPVQADIVENAEASTISGYVEEEFFKTEIKGSITGNKLVLNVTYANTSGLVGSWNYADTYVKIEAANGIILEAGAAPVSADIATAVVKNMIGQYLASLQTLILKEEGIASAKYLSLQGENKTAENVATYYVTTNKIHFIPELSFLLNLITKSTDTSALSSLGIKYSLSGNSVILFIDKEFLSSMQPVLSLLSSLLEDKPAIIENYIEPLLGIAAQADVFELGVSLER